MSNQEQVERLHILHIASGDLWAGAEAQIETLLSTLQVQSNVSVSAILLNFGELERRLISHGIDTVVFDETRYATPRLLQLTLDHIKALGPDIIHTHRQKEDVIGAIANFLCLKVPMIRTVHGANEHQRRGLRRRLIQIADRMTAHLVPTTLVAVSADMERMLAARFRTLPLVTIPNGVDVDRIRSAQVTPSEFAEEHDAVHVAFLGRLEPVKRVDIFLESASNLLSRHLEYDWRFHIFGDGALRKDLEQRAQDLGITPATTFHGHDPSAAHYLGSLNCVVLCSDHEGLPMILLEALAVGTPVVGHAVGGIAEVIDGTNGQLVDRQEPDAYAQAIVETVERNMNKGQLPRPRLISERWSSKANAAAYLRLYISATTP